MRIHHGISLLGFAALCAISFIGSSSQAQLVGHWNFDENFEDLSGLENHGFPEGEASLSSDVPPGLGGQSLLLEEDGDYVLVDHSESLDMTESMTVTAWVKTQGNAWEGLLAKNPSEGSPDNHAGNYEIRIENGSNQVHFLYQQGGEADTAFPISDDPLAMISPDTWTHIAVTVEQFGEEPGEVKYYTNGVLADTKPINVGFGAINENPLYIGTRADLFTQFNGSIDDLRIYNTALFEPEVGAVAEGAELDFSAPFPIAGTGSIGNVNVSSSIGNLEFSDLSEETATGLGQSWYAVANPGSKEGVDAIFQTNERAVPYFQAESGITWWSGSDIVSDVPQYPSEVDGVITGDNYTVKLEGEILIEESGPIRFLDGVDDFTYLAIDLDRSGTAGDNEEEVLINDDSWTNALSVGNGGAPIVEVDFENIADDGEWLAIEFNMAEAGGGDHGMLYWDAQDEDDFFPVDQGEGVADLDAFVFMIPDTHLRSPVEPAEVISGDAVGNFPARQAGWEIDVNAVDGTADTFVVDNPDEAIYSTVLDVDGVLLSINAIGDVSEGDSFQILVADTITGTPNVLTEGWNFDATTGSIVFGSVISDCNVGSMGDLDGNGTVEFADFLVLSQNFGQPATDHTTGDIDCSGTVEFADFLVLSQNFGQAVGAEPVPEPSGLALLGFAGLLVGIIRRRRS